MVELAAANDEETAKALEVLTYLNDARLPTGGKKRAWTLNLIREHLTKIFKATPRLKDNAGGLFARIDWASRRSLGRSRGAENSWWSIPASSSPKATIAMPV